MQKLKPRGKNTSKVEIHTSTNGIWLLVNDTEYFLSHKDYPWFKKATLAELYDVKLLNNIHLHWSRLDIDLDIESLEHPEKYPLIYR